MLTQTFREALGQAPVTAANSNEVGGKLLQLKGDFELTMKLTNAVMSVDRVGTFSDY